MAHLPDPDEYAEIVNLVGAKDMGAKIRHWERAIQAA